MLPLRAARARALLCPANLAPLAFPRNVVVIHDAAALRHPEWYSPAYAAWQRRVLPALARRALHVVTVSEFSRDELADLLQLAPARVSVVAGGVDPAFTPDADAEGVRRALGLTRPYVLCVASQTARKNLAALVPAARQLATRRGRGRRRRRAPAAVRARAGAGGAAPPRRRARRAAARPLRGRRGVRAPLALRGLRAARARGDGVRHAGDRRRRDRAAGHPGGAARLAPPEGEAFAAAIRDVLGSPPSGGACAPPGSTRAAPLHVGPDRARSGRRARARQRSSRSRRSGTR